MLIPGRGYNSEKYRFAFQGQEKDDEIKGSTGTSYAYKFRMHDPRTGRFWSIDPLSAKYPYNSSYAFSENRVIDGVELEGLEVVTQGEGKKDEPYELNEITVEPENKGGALDYSMQTFAQDNTATSSVVKPHPLDAKTFNQTREKQFWKLVTWGSSNQVGRLLSNDSYLNRASKLEVIQHRVSTSGYRVNAHPVGNIFFSSLLSGMTGGPINHLFSIYKLPVGTTYKQSSSAYKGVRSASNYLREIGVPRKYRIQVLQSFEIETISLRVANQSSIGLRFYGGPANATGRYLFSTFTNYTNRSGLALPYNWNHMTGLAQFKIRTGSIYLYGRAASQGRRFFGGSYQMYINNLDDLIQLR
jgi:RHS repeat-associated protein